MNHPMIIVIDTNIIVKAFKYDEPDHRHLTGLIGRNNRKLSCDESTQGTIFQEYRRNVGNYGGYQKWFTRLVQRQAIHFQNKYSLTKKDQTCLKGYECHEPTDLVFIGVAYHSGKILISEDSDVGKGPKGYLPPHCDALQYLTENMGVTVLDAQEACDYFDIILTKGIS